MANKTDPKPKASAPAKKRPGRPKKPADAKLEQFSIRLPPKLKFGLDLLARAQHRSMSQAVEWALQVGLNNYEVGYAGGDGVETIGSIIDRAWKSERESDRLIAVYDFAPALLPFEDFKVCELIERSYERSLLSETPPDFPPFPRGESSADSHKRWMNARQELENRHTALYYDFVAAYWGMLRSIAAERANAGKSTQDVALLNELGIKSIHGTDRFAVLGALADQAREHFPPEQFVQRVQALNEELRAIAATAGSNAD